jgi:hypothetical protein
MNLYENCIQAEKFRSSCKGPARALINNISVVLFLRDGKAFPENFFDLPIYPTDLFALYFIVASAVDTYLLNIPVEDSVKQVSLERLSKILSIRSRLSAEDSIKCCAFFMTCDIILSDKAFSQYREVLSRALPTDITLNLFFSVSSTFEYSTPNPEWC